MPAEAGLGEYSLACSAGFEIMISFVCVEDVLVFGVTFKEGFDEHVGVPALPGFVSNGFANVDGDFHVPTIAC